MIIFIAAFPLQQFEKCHICVQMKRINLIMDSKGNEKKSCKDVKRNKKVHLLHFSFQEKGIERQRTGNKYQILKSYIRYDGKYFEIQLYKAEIYSYLDHVLRGADQEVQRQTKDTNLTIW